MIIDNAGYDDGDSALRSNTRSYAGNATGNTCLCEDDAGYEDGDSALRNTTRSYAGNDTGNSCFCEDDAGYTGNTGYEHGASYAGYNHGGEVGPVWSAYFYGYMHGSAGYTGYEHGNDA